MSNDKIKTMAFIAIFMITTVVVSNVMVYNYFDNVMQFKLALSTLMSANGIVITLALMLSKKLKHEIRN
ncbi:hypothetical protein EQG49_06435 [Periweissella cryptocerci]|uniref:Uncharacterized protein n=1 Tax=Periweissella cryptocerci TaxID=2506420 RepID=A0A4P6YTT9_9LACO|nr:hypothetical protein [Periweissella cryptocerci]QBO36120.1 hypothetical protein EQG49_06435 [Periweissella cryptocerci]